IHGFRRIERDGFRCPPGQTVAECFAQSPERTMLGAWAPLCIAALNTPPARASAHVFAQVLREAFRSHAKASDFLLPATDLSALFPDAAAAYIERHGGTSHIGAAVEHIGRDGDSVAIATAAATERFDAAVIAVGPHQLASTLGETAAASAPWRRVLSHVER